MYLRVTELQGQHDLESVMMAVSKGVSCYMDTGSCISNTPVDRSFLA